MTVQQLRNALEQKKGQQMQLVQMLSTLRMELQEIRRSVRWHEQAREIVREVGLKTQQQLQYHISDITSLALESVFENPYRLEVEFVQRRNKTECDLLFVREDTKMDPLTASGGGAVDVAAFALRIASWTMMQPRSRNVIILDEPMRFLSVDNQEEASRMIQELSQKLNLQFIIITHESTLASYADRVFEVKIKGGRSKVTAS